MPFASSSAYSRRRRSSPFVPSTKKEYSGRNPEKKSSGSEYCSSEGSDRGGRRGSESLRGGDYLFLEIEVAMEVVWVTERSCERE